jgi:hypothetical protein
MKVTKIKMKSGCYYSANLIEIDELYVEGCTNPGYFKKAVIHDYLISNPGSICVNKYPYPKITPAVSNNGEKYVKSVPNDYTYDNLLALPRE